MKKILCVLFLTLLITGGVFAADPDFTGIWYLNYISMDGENVISVSDLAMDSEMVLNADGTASMTMKNGAEENGAEGTWIIAGDGIELVINDGTQTVVFQDGFLVFNTGDGGMMIYGREEPGPAFEPAEPDKEATAEDYEGTWLAFKAGMEGVGFFDWDMISSQLGMDTNEFVIKDGALYAFGEKDKPVELTFEEGGTMANRYENRDYAMLDTVATLLEDGTMKLEAMTTIFVLEKAEE